MSRKLKSNAGNFTIAEVNDLNGTAISQTRLTAASDLDEITTPGCYYYISNDNIVNLPTVQKFGALIVLRLTNTGMVKQVILTSDSKIYFRHCSEDGSWNPWYKVIGEEVTA